MSYDAMIDQLEEQADQLDNPERSIMIKHIERIRTQLKKIMELND